MSSRRRFLGRVLKGVAYSTPVITTLATPRELAAIIVSPMGGGMGMGMGMGMGGAIRQAPGPTAPWNQPPPWSPPSGPGGDDE